MVPTQHENIRVSVRIKPDDATDPQWEVDPYRAAVGNKDVGEFTFDHVYDGPVTNADVYQNSVEKLVQQVMDGYHGTVFAYGMTGSGKTYSMQGTSEDPGVIPLAVKSIYDYIAIHPERKFSVRLGYLEIYNEHLNDLLSPSTPSEDIKLRDDALRGVRPMGLREVEVNSKFDLLSHVAQGDSMRRTEGTEYNSRSSRSHAVVQIIIDSTGTTSGSKRSSTLYLCDLAGSERAVSQSERRKEGSYINKSLLTLGTVIARLSSGSVGHLPYRDSKLTRLLQPALSGRCLVSILCTVQTTTASYIETLSTLRFAARAKNIVVMAKRNDVDTDSRAIIEKLQSQIAQQKLEIQQLRGAVSDASLPSPSSTTSLSQSMNHVAQIEAENRILHERVEHLTRLCDDSRLDELLGVSAEDSDSDGDRKVQQQIEEYKSYISHLEKQLYNQEYNKVVASQELPEHSHNSSSHYQEVIADLREELEELRESNRDKDRIINALRASNTRKENIAAQLTHEGGSSTNTAAYARYYSPNVASPVIDLKDNFTADVDSYLRTSPVRVDF
jgi:protein tyrosine phosphatase (PTP) superfamily phosphohydrolase (DUF442 family)